jgi:hypothetical protein
MPEPRIKAFMSCDEHERHVRIMKMCKEEKVSLPRETATYFGDDSDDINPNCIEESIIEEKLEVDISRAVFEYKEEMIDGFEVLMKHIPKHVVRIRFYVSY